MSSAVAEKFLSPEIQAALAICIEKAVAQLSRLRAPPRPPHRYRHACRSRRPARSQRPIDAAAAPPSACSSARLGTPTLRVRGVALDMPTPPAALPLHATRPNPNPHSHSSPESRPCPLANHTRTNHAFPHRAGIARARTAHPISRAQAMRPPHPLADTVRRSVVSVSPLRRSDRCPRLQPRPSDHCSQHLGRCHTSAE